MKRLGNIYDKICNYENLLQAHEMAKKGKMHYKEVQIVENSKEKYLKNLEFILKNEMYYINSSDYKRMIINDKGKERIIMKTRYYPHRVVQWAIMLKIEERVLKSLTKDTYSAIKNRGLHKCGRKVRQALCDKNNTQYCLKLDIKKYYPSINKEILFKQYKRLIKDKKLLRLLKIIINSDGEKTGQPIGSLLSQWSGNLYLSVLDHYLKEELGVKYYFRYCDDIVILGSSKKDLRVIFDKIKTFVEVNLKLTIKGNYQIFPVDVRGIDFLGLRFFRNYTLLRKKILKRMKSNVKKMRSKAILTYSEFCTINSYMGWLKVCDSFKLFTKYIQPFNGRLYIDENRELRRINICLN